MGFTPNNNNRSRTSGRKHYHKLTEVLIGASIVPYNPTQRLFEISLIKDRKTRNTTPIRLAHLEFERSKRKDNESPLDHYIRDLSDFESMMQNKLEKVEYRSECYIKFNTIKSSRKIFVN